MPRIARVVIPHYPYHITQRGNNKETIFIDDSDRKIYIDWLKEYSQEFDLKIWAYCLMPNHVHFIVVPERENSLAKVFKQLHNRYALYFNKKRDRTGHLWQGRFFSSLLDNEYLIAAIRYVERNPVRAGLVARVEDYHWSSARAHVFEFFDSLLSSCPLEEEISNWSNYLASEDDPRFVKVFRKATFSGRIVGGIDFTKEIEEIAGRSLRLNPGGRPRKKVSVTVF